MSDKVINKISGVTALLIICFPCKLESVQASFVGLFNCPVLFSNIMHCASALVFFISLALNIYINFRKGGSTEQKKLRNVIYTVCAITISISTLGILIFSIWQVWPVSTIVCEFTALLAFGFAWLVKGEAISKFND